MMYRAIVVLLILLVSVGASLSAKCPCSDTRLCAPLTTPFPAKEVLAFQVNSSNSELYDFSVITTVAAFGDTIDPQLICKAHANNVRVVLAGIYPESQLTNNSYQDDWVRDLVQKVSDNFADGINIDYESAIAKDQTNQRNSLTRIVEKTRIALRKSNPHSMLTFDVAWSPNCIDVRCYDYAALASLTDYLLIMDYDTRSQIINAPCIASANSPLNTSIAGITEYKRLGIPPSKLVLGVPWYGYDYPCESFSESTQICEIKKVPFRSVQCSDAAGTQLGVLHIMRILADSTMGGRRWNSTLESPYFQYKDSNTGKIHQMWYDDVESLTIKYQYAKKSGVRGISMWQVDYLYTYGLAQDRKLRQEMWQAMKDFTQTPL